MKKILITLLVLALLLPACAGAALAAGVPLNDQFLGTGYHEDLRLWGDFGSRLYLVELLGEKEEDDTK